MEMTATRSGHIDHGSESCRAIARHVSWIGNRWTLPVVVTLEDGPMRFNQLRRAISDISQQMLTRTLRELERDGMVRRTVHPTVPPQVDYALTQLGESLADLGRKLGGWVEANKETIVAHRTEYDSGQTAI